jgi:hypothetical protein
MRNGVARTGSNGVVGGGMVIFFILAADADTWACHNFFGMKLASLNY